MTNIRTTTDDDDLHQMSDNKLFSVYRTGRELRLEALHDERQPGLQSHIAWLKIKSTEMTTSERWRAVSADWTYLSAVSLVRLQVRSHAARVDVVGDGETIVGIVVGTFSRLWKYVMRFIWPINSVASLAEMKHRLRSNELITESLCNVWWGLMPLQDATANLHLSSKCYEILKKFSYISFYKLFNVLPGIFVHHLVKEVCEQNYEFVQLPYPTSNNSSAFWFSLILEKLV
ncbi:hypothetical protein HELRODRAFT_169326 [Helobdella robusta]|uniref:Uncharacterized protein n=1 Tax=Helobdella robusta TaxID=6412 RepID=T1F1S3_HELRO|nr:hypothetical protein HELRODRAFT_169326 [Helobdella robusta]ESO08474.1 hypothetical protein HELRODRAFT_169326 [Helobdella robusta]